MLSSSSGRTHHILKLTYEQYLKVGRSITNSVIGKYVIYEEIGKGAFGSVYKGMNDETKKVVAIKVLDLDTVERDPNERVKQIRRRLCRTESEIMLLCNSDNLVKCYDVYENKSLKIMVIQYCSGGTLQDQINSKGRIPENEAILILKQIINGIAELHQHKIVHRDLKAENILVHNGVYKIADFGFSKQIGHQEELVKQTTLGTITTMAPQVMRRQPYGLKADIWSMGVIFFQMVFGKVPYTSVTAAQMYQEIKSKKILDSETFAFKGYTASKEVTTFLREVLVIECQNRLGWKSLISHPLFKGRGGKLDNEFRIDIDIKGPKGPDEDENKLKTTENNFDMKVPEQLFERKPEPVIKMSAQEAQEKKQQIINDDDKIYLWAKTTHLECLKTQLIYDEIIEKIETYKLLDQNDRDVIEFMYLLSTRCLNNISIINDKMEKEKNHYIVQNLYKTIKVLYQRVKKNWEMYSNKLTNVENEVTSIISDKFKKIFKSQSVKEKDNYLTGIETIEYSKDEQIQFTENQYIKELKKEIKMQGNNNALRVKDYLSHYKEINLIKLEDLKEMKFSEYVHKMMQ